MNEKNVVMLVRGVRPEDYGGGETYQLELAMELEKNGLSPMIATSSTKLLEEAQKQKIATVRIPYYKWQNFSGWRNAGLLLYIVRQWRLTRWYRKTLTEYHVRVVNVQSRDEWIAVTRAAVKNKIKVLWTDHIDFRTWVMTNVKVPYKNMIGKWILKMARRADKVIFISDHERRWFERNCSHDLRNLVTIKNGVADRRAEFTKIKSARKSICYVGRVVEYKGIGELIEAFRGIGDEEARLNVYGDGEASRYQKMAQGDERIMFYGYTDEPLMKMAENEIFVLPSYYEGLSLALVEAAMMGKKIIATNVDGNPEVVGNGAGILVPAKDVDGLRKAMVEMLAGGNEMAKKARARYEKDFDFDKIFKEKMLKLYKEDA